MPLPQALENNSGFTLGALHREGSLIFPSSEIPLVHSGRSSIHVLSTNPQLGHVGKPSLVIILAHLHSLHKLLSTDFINIGFF